MSEIDGDTITTQGTGRVESAPDIAEVRVGVSRAAKDVASARDQAAAKMRAAVAVLRAGGVDESDLRTDALSSHSRGDDRGRHVGYIVSTRIVATVRDVERAQELVDRLFDAVGDGLQLNGISFRTDDPRSDVDLALDAAFADAERKAQRLAARSRRTLGRVIAIHEGQVLGMPTPARRMRAVPAAASMPVEVGDVDVSASIEVRWELIDG